jgi:hypothetical protein
MTSRSEEEISLRKLEEFLKQASVCEGCEAVVRSSLGGCPQCFAYCFDANADRVGAEAAHIMREIREGSNFTIHFHNHQQIDCIQWRVNSGARAEQITIQELVGRG